jgi:hypothetical protein
VSGTSGRDAQPGGQTGTPAGLSDHLVFALAGLAAFGLYWLSSSILQARGGITSFGADTLLYAALAGGDAVDRITRFHPLTAALAAVWMKIVGPLTPWISPLPLLKALFAAIGAVGVWAAMWAFAAVVPRRQAILWGAIYAVSLGVWYFSSIEESKIVSGTLATLYIAAYLRLRQRWTTRGALILSAILLLACLNEIVAALLVAIPAVDTLVQRGWDWRAGVWIAWHGLAAVLAFAILEGLVNGYVVPAVTDPESSSHLSMLIYYVLDNDFSLATIYGFLVNWLFFNIAAPTRDAVYVFPHWPDNRAYFEPALTNYLFSPISAILAAAFGAMVVASVLPRYRSESVGPLRGVLAALLAYTVLRGLLFFTFNPNESLLFSTSVTLAHLLMMGILFAGSSFPAKQGLLAACAVLLLAVNGAFIMGP